MSTSEANPIEHDLSAEDHRDAEVQRVARLVRLFATAPTPPDPFNLWPDYGLLKQELSEVLRRGSRDVEEVFLRLYCHVHGHEAPYLAKERACVNRTGGYWCHAGGIAPIIKAPDYLHEQSVSVDLGAGNGLQCLLMQYLKPHRLSIQVEISSKMVASGKALARWLKIPEDRLQWVVGDVLDHIPERFDFLYLYRPVRPSGPGLAFYRQLAERLLVMPHDVTVFSVADCLRDHLPPTFSTEYFDGHLTIMRRSIPAEARY